MQESAKLIQALSSKGKPIHLKRGDHLITAGEIEHHLYLVRDGLIRAYYINAFEEHTIRFGYTGSIINALDSYFSKTPSSISLEALKTTEVIALRKEEIYAYLDEHNLHKVYVRILETLAVQQFEREIDLLTQSPIERYQRVFNRSPRLFLEAPAKYIASYLRMSPETLSRIRNS